MVTTAMIVLSLPWSSIVATSRYLLAASTCRQPVSARVAAGAAVTVRRQHCRFGAASCSARSLRA